jgi:arylsulfate sulfotransferase
VETNYFDKQKQIDESIQAEVEKGYSFEEALIIVNPYGSSPLSAVAIFTTDTDMGGTITVKGKVGEDDIVGSFEASMNHIVPIYGLYSGDTTEVVITFDDGTSKTFEVVTDSVGVDTQGTKVEMYDKSAYDYSDLTFISDATNNHMYAVDSKGDVRFHYNNGGVLGVKALSNGHLIIPTSYTLKTQYYKSGIMEIDLLGKVYYEYAIPGGMHHDMLELSNGNLLVAADRPSFETVEDYVVEIEKETGEVVWELDMATLINTSEGGSLNRTEEDWFHNNGIWYDEETDTLLLSARHVDAIVAVDKSDKTLKWIIGDSSGWSEEYRQYFFTPTGENFEWQYAQHQVTMLSNEDIMCFDNGAGRTKTTNPEAEVTGDDVYSRAVVYRIDEENMTIEQVWEYGKEDPNNIWITSGSNLYSEEKDSYDYGPSDMFTKGLEQSTIIGQVKENELVYEMKLGHLTYRTFRLSPYDDVDNYDVAVEGKYLGSLGFTETVDVSVDLKDSVQAENCILTLDPTKLTFSSSYTVASTDDLKDSYLVLQKDDGTVMVYSTAQTHIENDVAVNVTGFISTTGLEGSTYDVYVVLSGNAYNTGYRMDLYK